MNRYLACMAMLSIVLLGGCDGVDPAAESKVEGANTYTYTAFDAAGDVVVVGTLQLDYDRSVEASGSEENISGTWDLRLVKNIDLLGPQVGEGSLQGSISGEGEIRINLNPAWNDNNVFLAGHFEDDRFSDIEGTWTYSTILGGVNNGRFEADRK